MQKVLSFDQTTLNEFVEWAEGQRDCLSPLAASDLGLDQWLYELRKKPMPSPEQEDQLKRRVWELAHESPLTLWKAMQTRTLRILLGEGFEWVQTPETW